MDEFKLPSYLKMQGDSVIYNDVGEFQFYVPEKQFDLNVAKQKGEFISLLGIIDYSVDKPGIKKTLKPFNCPTRFMTKPHTVEKLRNVKLTANTDNQDYRLLRYIKDDIIIQSIYVEENIANVENLMSLFIITGNVPSTIPYDKIQNYITDNIDANGYNYGVSLQLIGLIISKIARSNKDRDIPFRLSKNSDMMAYQTCGIKEVAKMANPYMSIISENIDDSIVHSILNKDKDIYVPMEKYFMGDV